MLTREEVLDLIKRTKVPVEGSEINFDLNHTKNSYVLADRNDDKIQFKLDLTQSIHVSFKLSCHHRDGSDFGLIRVDYNGGHHTNPQVITSNVPKILHPYAGIKIDPRVNHVHIFVEKEGLNWAMPLENFSNLGKAERDEITISQLNINNHADKNKAVQSFFDTINLKANTSFIGGLILN